MDCARVCARTCVRLKSTNNSQELQANIVVVCHVIAQLQHIHNIDHVVRNW